MGLQHLAFVRQFNEEAYACTRQHLPIHENFESNLAHHKSARYNETQARVEFINPFFEALGWDIDNKRGLRPRVVSRVSWITLQTSAHSLWRHVAGSFVCCCSSRKSVKLSEI